MGLSKTEILRERQWRRCRGKDTKDVSAFLRFCEGFVKIQRPDTGSVPFELRPAQREIIEVWMKERNSLVLKARQIGWSTLVAVYALWLAFFWDDQLIVMLSRNEREAQKLLFKATYAYDRLPQWMRDRGPKRTANNVQKLPFANASVIESLPSKEDPARGSAVSLIIVDEWAFFENAEEAWAAIEPVTDIGGRVIGLSTASGSGNFFHGFWVKATTGVSDFKPMFYPWWANDERNDAWYETKRRNLLDWQLHQEYPATPEEAFIKSGNPVFDTDQLSKIEPVDPERGYIDTLDGVRAPRFVPTPEGELRIWSKPSLREGYVMGIDVAEGLEHGDFSSIHVVALSTGLVAAVYHAHIDPDLLGDVAAALGWYYSTALIGCEVNNHGLTTCKALQRAGYPRIYYRREVDARTNKQSQKIGWYTSTVTKPLMVDELAMALRRAEDPTDPAATIEPEITLLDSETIGELRTFIRDAKGKTHGSPFDDRVISLSIANQMRKHHHATGVSLERSEYWTMDYFVQKALKEDAQDGRVPIGAHNVRRSTLS